MVKIKIINDIKYILGCKDTENHEIILQSKKIKENIIWFHLNNNVSGHCLVYLKNYKLTDTIKMIACNFIKQYSKFKNNKNLLFCYTSINNIIILDKAGAVSFYNDNDVKKYKHNDSIIYHSSNYDGGNSSEYIIPLSYNDNIRDYNFDITSHRIGSGIYGLATKDKNTKYEFKLLNPLVLITNDECLKYMEISKKLNDYLKDKDVKHADEICNFFNINIDTLKKVKKDFLNDLKNRKDMVMMPINYLMYEIGYDGIYSKNTILDSYTKGNIKFTKYPTKKNKEPVQYFKRRKGINEYIYKIK